MKRFQLPKRGNLFFSWRPVLQTFSTTDLSYEDRIKQMTYEELINEVNIKQINPHKWTRTDLQTSLLLNGQELEQINLINDKVDVDEEEEEEEEQEQEEEDEDEEDEEEEEEDLSTLIKENPKAFSYKESRAMIVKREIERQKKLLEIYPHLFYFEEIFKGVSSLEPRSSNLDLKQHYLENRNEEEIQNEFLSISPIEARKEFTQFLLRSRLVSSKTNKAKTVPKQEIIESYYSMVLLEKEYKSLKYSCNTKIFKDHKTPLEVTMIELKELANSQNFYNSKNKLEKITEAEYTIFAKNLVLYGIEKFDVAHLEYILEFASNLKGSLDYQIIKKDVMSLVLKSLIYATNKRPKNYSLGSLAHCLEIIKKMTYSHYDGISKEIEHLISTFVDAYKTQSTENQIKKQDPVSELSECLKILELLYSFHESGMKQKIRPVIEDLITRLEWLPPVDLISGENVIKIILASIIFEIRLTENLLLTIVTPRILKYIQSFYEVYIIIFCFKFSNVSPKGQFMDSIMRTIIIFLDRKRKSRTVVSMKDLRMVCKILEYFLKECSKLAVKKTVDIQASSTLALMEDFIQHIPVENLSFFEVMDCANIFLPYTSSPKFFMNSVLQTFKLVPEAIIGEQNFKAFSSFVSSMLTRHEPKSVFIWSLNFTNDNFLNVEKKQIVILTETSLELFQIFFNKFSSSKLLNFQFLALDIMLSPVFPYFFSDTPSQRSSVKNFSSKLIQNIMSYPRFFTKDQNNTRIIALLNLCIQFPLEENIIFLFSFFSSRIKEIIEEAKKEHFLNILPLIYLLSKAFLTGSARQLLKGISNAEISSQIDAFAKTLSDFYMEEIIPKVSENHKHTYREVKYTGSTTQYFTNLAYNTNFTNIEYVLPTLSNLGLDIPNEFLPFISSQIERSFKRWNGQMLSENILFFANTTHSCWGLFEILLEGFSSFLQSETGFLILLDSIPKQSYLDLAREVFRQFEMAGKPQIKTNTVFFSLFVSLLCNDLLQSDLESAVGILGVQRENYTMNLRLKFNQIFNEKYSSADLSMLFRALLRFPIYVWPLGFIEKIKESFPEFVSTLASYEENELLAFLDVFLMWKLYSQNFASAVEKFAPIEKFVDYMFLGIQEDPERSFKFILDWIGLNEDRIASSGLSIRTDLAYLYYKANIANRDLDPSVLFQLPMHPASFEEDIRRLVTKDHPVSLRNYLPNGQVLNFFFPFKLNSKVTCNKEEREEVNGALRNLRVFCPLKLAQENQQNKNESFFQNKEESKTGIKPETEEEGVSVENEILREKESKQIIDNDEIFIKGEELIDEEDVEQESRMTIEFALKRLLFAHFKVKIQKVEEEDQKKMKFILEVASTRGIDVSKNALEMFKKQESNEILKN